MRRLASLIVTMTLAALCAGSAGAQTCFIMQAELMHLLSQGQGGVGDRARYERAYREQFNALAITERQARRARCFGGGFFLFNRGPGSQCQALLARMREMQNNLGRLDQLRRQAGADNAYRIRELQGMMQARGCALPGRSFMEAAPNRGLLWEDDRLYSARGTYRTLCVRRCDGYYFPISFSTVPDRLTFDAEICEAMCPGTDSQLYYHPNPGGGPETMVSLTGEAYASLATAFQYRTSYDPDCTCRPPGGYSVAAAQTPIASVARPDPTAPKPRPRPAPGQDPETLANRAGDFVPGIGAAPRPGTAVASAPDGSGVRIVGPTFWGSPEQDGVVITPIPN